MARYDRRWTEVRSDDPDLSREANDLLTAELRDAIGADRVPRPPSEAPSVPRRSPLAVALSGHRLLIAITFAALVIIGLIVALTTGSWWVVVAAAAVHALATVTIATLAVKLSTEVEHVAPETAARLEAEGVADPDRALSDLVDRYAPGDEAGGAAEVVSSGNNRVTSSPADDPARASAEQRTALTPAADPVEPSSRHGALVLLPLVAVAGSSVVALAVAAIEGGVAWVAALLVLGAAAGWLALQLSMRGDGGAVRPQTAGRTRLLATVALIVAVVIAGVIVVGAVAGYL